MKITFGWQIHIYIYWENTADRSLQKNPVQRKVLGEKNNENN